jgi:hypothetical protein
MPNSTDNRIHCETTVPTEAPCRQVRQSRSLSLWSPSVTYDSQLGRNEPFVATKSQNLCTRSSPFPLQPPLYC